MIIKHCYLKKKKKEFLIQTEKNETRTAIGRICGYKTF